MKRRLGKVAIGLGVVVAVLLVLPLVAALARTAASLAVLAVQIAGLLILFVGLPFLLWVLAKPLYRTFLMPTVRAIHIRKIRANRELMEAALREKE
jgi:Kef-type K+ transport system membrane component KefB